MAYTKTTWVDRMVDTPNRYTKSNETSGEVTLTPSPGTVTAEGTPVSSSNMNKIEQGIKDVDTALVAHGADFANPHAVTKAQVGLGNLDNSTIAKFKSGSSSYTDNDASQTFTDAFCTANSQVIIVITSATVPQGKWTVNTAAGSFTITSDATESVDITFDYFITKVV